METLGALVSPAVAQANSARDPEPAHSMRDVLRLRPGWPVVLLFVGYPLWWMLGLTDVAGLVAAIAMVVTLVKRPRVRVPRAFGIVLLFLVWIVLSFLVIQVAAPGAVAVANGNRYLTASWRLLWYLKAVILMLYLGNERERLRQAWICRTLGWMFVWVVAGGLLGVIKPTFEFRSLAELVLPRGLATTPFVYASIHPVAAERFTEFLGGSFRTSAPFAYANVWGLNLACFLPFFVVGWLGRDATRRRRLTGWVILAISVVPIVLSLNRGLWLALGAIVLVVAIRAVLGGQLRLVALLAGGMTLVAIVIAVSPLGAHVERRLSGNGPNSADTRSNLTSLTLSSVRSASPLLGFGATRNVQGNFTSIAGGASSTCRRCAPPALGTQGQLLFVVFTQGFVGAALYFGFLLLQFFRHIRIRSGYVTAGLAVLVAHFVTSTVYSADNLAVLAIFASIALLWRAEAAQRIGDASGQRFAPDEALLADYGAALRRHVRPVIAIVVAGGLVGVVVAFHAGAVYRATESIYVAQDPTYPAPAPEPPTLDDVARGATSAVALNAMRRAVGPYVPVDRDLLSIAATPNTRVLHVTYAGNEPYTAQVLAAAAAAAMLRLRLVDMQVEQQQVTTGLTQRLTAIETAIGDVRHAAAHADQPGAVRGSLNGLLAQLRETGVELSMATQVPLDAGHVLTPAQVTVSRDGQQVDVANGIALGVLLAAGLLLFIAWRTPRVAALTTTVAGLPVLWRGVPAALNPRDVVQRHRPGTAVAAGVDPAAVAAASRVDAAIPVADRGVPRVLIFVAADERARTVRRAAARLGDAHLLGVAVLSADRGGVAR